MSISTVVEFKKGEFQEFSAKTEFALNFDDRHLKSIKMRVGEKITYDGETAVYYRPNGEQVMGRVASLRSVINKAGWLVPIGAVVMVEEESSKKGTPSKDYDPKIGGNFEGFLAADTRAKPQIITEKDRIVKYTGEKKAEEPAKKTGKLEVSGDQVAVKERTIVSNSTSTSKPVKRTVTVTKADEMGAEGTLPISMKKQASEAGKKNSFIVDTTTPSVSEGASMAEVQRAKGVIQAGESQEARVVKTLDRTKPEVEQVEGITMRKVNSPKEMTITTTSGSGGTPITDIQSEGTVVSKTPNPAALARAEARKKAASQTQAMLEAEKVTKVASEETPKATVPAEGDPNYLSMLPADWGSLHWVKKEKFVKSLTDKAFIQFILSVETVKAVLNACEERLIELG
jgi:hypothetical protein